MEHKYHILLFCNGKQKKILDRVRTLPTARLKYRKLIQRSQEVMFNRKTVNGKSVEYFIGLVGNNDKVKKRAYTRDEMGRNVTMEIMDFQSLLDIMPYRVEEKLYDNILKRRITFDELQNALDNMQGLKMLYKLNSHLLVETEGQILFYSLKSVNDCENIISALMTTRIRNGKTDCIFSRDVDTLHRKYLYDWLKRYGLSTKKLTRHGTR